MYNNNITFAEDSVRYWVWAETKLLQGITMLLLTNGCGVDSEKGRARIERFITVKYFV